MTHVPPPYLRRSSCSVRVRGAVLYPLAARSTATSFNAVATAGYGGNRGGAGKLLIVFAPSFLRYGPGSCAPHVGSQPGRVIPLASFLAGLVRQLGSTTRLSPRETSGAAPVVAGILPSRSFRSRWPDAFGRGFAVAPRDFVVSLVVVQNSSSGFLERRSCRCGRPGAGTRQPGARPWCRCCSRASVAICTTSASARDYPAIGAFGWPPLWRPRASRRDAGGTAPFYLAGAASARFGWRRWTLWN